MWQHIKVPQSYMSANWPIRYSSLSSDGRLIAIAGRRGLVHYSSTSGRWKMFADERQEQAFTVKGGLLWFHHVLIAAVEVAGAYQVSSLSVCRCTRTEPRIIGPFVLARSGTQQPERPSPRSDTFGGCHPLPRRQFIVGVHCGQHSVPLLDHPYTRLDQVASMR